MLRHAPKLLKLAAPLVLSSSSITAMQVIDAIVVARHSESEIAALGTSSMAVILIQGLLFGISGYAGTFAAHSHGAEDSAGTRRAAWLGIHVSWIAGIAAAFLAWPLTSIFSLVGHAPGVAAAEISYARICIAGSFLPVFCAAMGGWLSGTGRTRMVTGITLASFAVNAILAWGLVLGKLGFPERGISGAALATLGAQATAALLYAVVFLRDGGFADRDARAFQRAEFFHFLKLAIPQGLRISSELLAWTLFLVYIGRIGQRELAASSIAFRINSTAFFPAMGLAQACAILVGQARGAGRDEDVPSIGWQSLVLTEIWMTAMAILFVSQNTFLFSMFAGTDSAEVQRIGTILLWFVAFYSLFDSANIVMGFALAAAGDTRWVGATFMALSAVFILGLVAIDHFHGSVWAFWSLATAFVITTAATWLWRFHGGAWKRMQVLRESQA